MKEIEKKAEKDVMIEFFQTTYCMLRCLTSSLLHFEEKTSAEKIILSYVGKGNAAWLQLYAFLCAQTGCLITGRLPGAKAINALIQAEKNGQRAWTVEPDYQEAEEEPHWRRFAT